MQTRKISEGVYDRCVQPVHRSGTQICSTGRFVRSHASASESSIPSEAKSVSKHQHIMLALIDQRPYLSDGSKQAIAAAISYGETSNSQITVTLLEVDPLAEEDKKKRLETVMWHFQQSGFSNVEVLEKEAGKASVTIGDVADEIAANIVIISVEPIHAKVVDANLLAEFVPCPILLVP
ncbi:hypothetical protein WJX79_008523 [Trebouxia sp. C0005]